MAEVEVDADEFVAVDPGEVAFGDGGFDVGLDFGEAGQVCFARGEGLFVEVFEVDGAEGADVWGELAVPVDKGALGDVEVGGDAREAEAFGAEFGEPVFNVVRMHGPVFAWFGRRAKRSIGSIGSIGYFFAVDGFRNVWAGFEGRVSSVEGRSGGVVASRQGAVGDRSGEWRRSAEAPLRGQG